MVGRVLYAALGFAAGAVAGGLFVRWYVTQNAAGLGGRALGDKLFGEGTFGSNVVADIGHYVDEARN